MNFIKFAIQNPVKVAVGVILAVMFGGIAYFATPVRLTPDVEEPEITVTTRWRGASAKEVEEQIVEQQEEYLKSVEGLREFKSSSVDAQATLTLKFAVGTDLGTAAANVRDKLNQVPSYPENVDRPVITTVNPNANAIAWFMLKPLPPTRGDLKAFAEKHPDVRELLSPMIEGKEEVELAMLAKWAVVHPELRALTTGKDQPNKMRKFAEDFIEARFERVKGIANANVLGGREQEFRIVVDPNKLAANSLTITDLRNAIRAANRNTSGGDIREGKNKNVVRTIGLYDSPDKVENTVVAIRDNTPVRVKDVARVGVAYTKPEGVVRQSGVESLAVNAQQAPGSNLIEVMGPPLEKFDLDGDGEITQTEIARSKQLYGDSLRLALAELNTGILKNRGLRLEQVYDQTDYLNSAKDLVVGNIYIGGTLAILVLLLFLRSPRSVLIIAMAIPISVVATFIFVRGFGRTVNVISLAGMAFAVGMVVDNAIVVLENIFRHYQEGEDPDTAAYKGTSEVWGAVLASTLTTLAVFIPVLFVQGQAGQLFRDIAIAISCAVGLSLIVSITVIPAAAKRILKKRTGEEAVPAPVGVPTSVGPASGEAPGRLKSVHQRMRKVFDFGGHFIRALTGFIRMLQTMPFNIGVRLAVIVLFVTASLAGAYFLAPKTEYLPDGNRNLVVAMLLPPPGYSVEKMIKLGEQEVEPKVAPYWEAKPGSPEEKKLEGPRIKNFFFVARGNRLFMGARTVDPLRAGELVPFMNKTVRSVPGMIAFATQASLFESALTGGRTIDIEITGPDLKTLVQEGRKAMGMCLKEFPMFDENGNPTGNQIQPIPGLDLSSPEIHVVSDKVKAAEMKVTDEDLGYSVDALVDGAYAGEYWHNGRKIDLVIFGAEEFVRHSHDLKDLPIATPTGKVVPVGAISSVTLSNGPNQIEHSERLRTITLRLKPAPNIPLETALQTVDEKIRQPLLKTSTFEGGTYQVRLAGTADKLAETRLDVQWKLVLALVITYLLMAALFESFFYPLISMASVALALVGGFVGLWVLNLFIPQKLDMLTMLGFVILVGTVVNNAILIVHQALNHMREDGLNPKDAVVESVRTRVRPIFMTTVTTVLGMLPLVVPIPTWTDSGIRFLPGAGSELYRGLGAVVLGGLIVSTMFTLILIPIAFSLAVDLRIALAKLLGFGTLPELQPAVADASLPGQTGTIAADMPLGLRDNPVSGEQLQPVPEGHSTADGNGDGAPTPHGPGGASPVSAPHSPDE